MHLHRVVAGLTALALLTTPALSAPLSEDGSRAEPSASTTRASLPTVPVNRPAAAGGLLADQNGNRLSDGFERMLAGMSQGERVDVVATFSRPVDLAAVIGTIGAFDLRYEFTLIDGFAATMTAGQARALASAPGIFRVEEDFILGATLSTARQDFGVESLASNAATAGVNGSGIGICVVDTGINASHEQFVNELDGASKVLGFQDFIGDVNGVFQSLPYDDQGHGTHVSGIAAGDGTGTELGVQLRGVAPGANLYVAKVLDATGFGPNSVVIQGVEWCNQAGVHVINLSLAEPGSSDGQDALSLSVNALADAGKIVVIGAGNAGSAPFTIGSPAAAERGITVGAAAEWSGDPLDLLTGQWYSPGVFRAPFSSVGPTKDGRIKPDITAPGHSIASSYIDPLDIWGCGNACYSVLSGTSMASPFMAGTVALMLDSAGGSMTTDEAMQILATTAQDRGPAAGKDNEWGHGLLDVYAAVAAAQGLTDITPTAFPVTSSGTGSVPDGGSTLIPLEVTDPGAPLAVTILSDGSFSIFGWSPDLEARLLDGAGLPFLEPNPLYPWLSDEPYVAVLGTESTCPAGIECGAYGRQETVWLTAPVPGNYFLEVFPFDGMPNNGKGGSFSYVTSNAVSPSAANSPPVAAFTQSCTDLSCSFNDTSTDSDGTVTAWAWDFGDGNVSSLQNPSHGYAVAGSYTVALTVTDDAGDSATTSQGVTVSAPNNPPVAGFMVSCTDLDCSFTDASSDSDGVVTAWAWDFGDGAVSSTQNPSHSYAAAGSYTVALTVTDDAGDSATTSQGVTVSVPNVPPVAAFTESCAGLDCAFSDASSDSDGTVTTWAWDFGDGAVSSLQNPSHSYAAGGTYTVALTVTDNNGDSATTLHSVTVSVPNVPPVAAFSESCAGLDCAFADASSDSDGTVTAWVWDFGDGAVSSAQNPSHSYAAAGSYTVALTVTDDAGASGTTSHSVTVSDAALPPTVLGCSPDNGNLSTRLTVRVTGTGFQDGAMVGFGPRITAQGVTFLSSTEIDVRIRIQRQAELGIRDVTVLNADGQIGTSTGGCFTVNP